MARSLDDLIEFLLEQIALDGTEGISLKQLVAYVEQFYRQPPQTQSSNNQKQFHLDYAFLRQLWRWLSRHQDVSLGHDHEHDSSSLDEVVLAFPKILDGIPNVKAPDLSPVSTSQELSEAREDGVTEAININTGKSPPRIYVSEDLVYYAICGHAYDPSRVFASEWELLCCIASTRYEGILQGPLGHKSGQDKRSVPKRTDALFTKGYIVKKAVMSSTGHTTSRLWLRKFAQRPGLDQADDAVRLKHIARRVCSMVEQNGKLTQDDICTSMSMNNPAAAEMMSRIIQHLVEVGCLERRRVSSTLFGDGQGTQIYIRSVRPLEDQDLSPETDTLIDFDMTDDDFIDMIKSTMDSDELEAAQQENAERDVPSDSHGRAQLPRRPQWNPDRLVPNTLLEFAHRRGDLGFTNILARRSLTGMNVRRPMESILVRLSHTSLQSQPPHLKHLAIVRTSELARSGVNVYIYRSVNTYKHLVEEGTHFWSLVIGGKEISTSLQNTPSGDIQDTLQRDEHGIFTCATPKGQLNGGMISQAQMVKSSNAIYLVPRLGEPELVRDCQGNVSLRTYEDQETTVDDYSFSTFDLENGTPSKPAKTKVQKKERPPRMSLASTASQNAGQNLHIPKTHEKFWGSMFTPLRDANAPKADIRTKRGKVILLSEPAIQALYDGRPEDFDEMLTYALQNRLKLPASAEEVTQAWVDLVRAISLGRNTEEETKKAGTFEKQEQKQLYVILRCSRLAEVQVTMQKASEVLSTASVAAHSSRYLGDRSFLNKAPTKLEYSKNVDTATIDYGPNKTKVPPILRFASVAAHSRQYLKSRAWLKPLTGKQKRNTFATPQSILQGIKSLKSSKKSRVRAAAPAVSSISDAPEQSETILQPAHRVLANACGSAFDVPPAEILEGKVTSNVTDLLKVNQFHTTAASNQDPSTIPRFAGPDLSKIDASDETAARPLQAGELLSDAKALTLKRTLLEELRGIADNTAISPAANRFAMSITSGVELTPIVNSTHEMDAGFQPTQELSSGTEGFTTQNGQIGTTEDVMNNAAILPPASQPCVVTLEDTIDDTLTKQTKHSGVPDLSTALAEDALGHGNTNMPAQTQVAESADFSRSCVPMPRVVFTENEDALNPHRSQAPPSRRLPDRTVLVMPSEAIVGVNSGNQNEELGAELRTPDQKSSTANSPLFVPEDSAAQVGLAEHRVSSQDSEPQDELLNDNAQRDDAWTPDNYNDRDTRAPELTKSPGKRKNPGQAYISGPSVKKIRNNTIRPSDVLVGRDGVAYYRRILIELVTLCGGVMPKQPSMIKQAMVAKCIEQHIDDNPNVKLIKSQIQQLCDMGQLKSLFFACEYNGTTTIKGLLALPNKGLDDPECRSMQQKMSSIPKDEDYVPPELRLEMARKPTSILRDLDASPLPTANLRNGMPAATAGGRHKKKEGSDVLEDEKASKTPIKSRSKKASQNQQSNRTIDREIRQLGTPIDLYPRMLGFLTLKTPSLGTLNLDDGFMARYRRIPAIPQFTEEEEVAIVEPGPVKVSSNLPGLPAVPLRFNIDADHVETTTAPPTSKKQRKSGLRMKPRNIQWRPMKVSLPRTINALLVRDKQKDIEVARYTDENLGAFDREVDFVREWEDKTWRDLPEFTSGEWKFWNHKVLKGQHQGILSAPTTWHMLEFDVGGHEHEIVLDQWESWQIFADCLEEVGRKKVKASDRLLKRKRTLSEADSEEDDREDNDFEVVDGQFSKTPPSKRKRKHVKALSKRLLFQDKEVRDKRATKSTRGIGIRNLGEGQIFRLCIIFVVVKTLAGGLDRFINWKLIFRLWPQETESIVRERYKRIHHQFVNTLDTLSWDLQDKYLDGLADGYLPSIDYDDIHATNWEAIVEWAVKNLSDGGAADESGLPFSREQLLALQHVETEEVKSTRFLHGHRDMAMSKYTLEAREDAYCAELFAVPSKTLEVTDFRPIKSVIGTEESLKDPEYARARSWMFATICTPANEYDTRTVDAKLRKLCEEEDVREALLSKASLGLAEDLVITKNEGKGKGLCGFRTHQRFERTLREDRWINADMLLAAVDFKLNVLDQAFAQGEMYTVSIETPEADGTMLCVLNLLAMGQATVTPGPDIPGNRYGIDFESVGYETRKMDVLKVLHTVVVAPTQKYLYGDLLSAARSRATIPRGGTDDEITGIIPSWISIHGKHIPKLWNMYIGAVVGLVSTRPGIDCIEIVRTLEWKLTMSDIELILGYLVRIGAVKACGSGWETEELWWFAIGASERSELEETVAQAMRSRSEGRPSVWFV